MESGGATIFNRPGRLGRRRWNIWRDRLGRDEIKKNKRKFGRVTDSKKAFYFLHFYSANVEPVCSTCKEVAPPRIYGGPEGASAQGLVILP